KNPSLAEEAISAITFLDLEKRQLLLENLAIQSIVKCNITLLKEINKILPINELALGNIKEKGMLLLKQDSEAIPFLT
ncbi:MAG: hypothetical protein JO131_07710, partial [Gammaproteobacteria bacterium]|nr:hypothetical protein [Gammaproteobacteria bacterium]